MNYVSQNFTDALLSLTLVLTLARQCRQVSG